MLKDNIEWPSHRQFNSNKEWEPLYLFSECLFNSISFDLCLGFFSSSAIRTLACGFASFIYYGGKMRLIINNILSVQDKQTVTKSFSSEAIPAFDLSDISKLSETLSAYDQHFFDCLAFLIREKRIEILIIEPLSGKGIAHTKSGIFYDSENSVAFNGSCNFTQTALIDNIETLDAFCDWDGNIAVAKLDNIRMNFEEKFSKKDTSVAYIEPADIVTNIESTFGGKSLSDLLNQERELFDNELESNITETTRPQILSILRSAKKRLENNIQENDEELSKPKFPFGLQPRDYQQLAFERWKENGQKGLFAMATGTGKTLTALNCLLEIYRRKGYYKAIILVPTLTLIHQWADECKRFNFRTIVKVCSKNKQWQVDVDSLRLQERINDKIKETSYVIIATYASFAKNTTFNLLNSFNAKKLLFIADEAHNMGASMISNKLNAIRYSRRIGLSATPERQFDDIGNKELAEFWAAQNGYTYEYSMKAAIANNVLCSYVYYPHIVCLSNEEMEDYKVLSRKISKFVAIHGFQDDPDAVLSALLLKRKRIIHKAVNKIDVFEKIISDIYEKYGTLKYTLVYVPEGGVSNTDSDIFNDREDVVDDDTSQSLIDLFSSKITEVSPTTTVKQFKSSSKNKDILLRDFASGKLEVLTSMKCLDEGVDVPQSKVAIFCSSTGNPRQFVQRRGRILRQSRGTGKEQAIIHDLVVVPDFSKLSDEYNIERQMVISELARVRNFALLSENSNSTIKELNDILRYYNLSLFTSEDSNE